MLHASDSFYLPLLPAVDHLHGHRLPMAKNTDKWRAKYANYFAVAGSEQQEASSNNNNATAAAASIGENVSVSGCLVSLSRVCRVGIACVAARHRP